MSNTSVVTGLGDRLSWWEGPGLNFLVRHVARSWSRVQVCAAIRFNLLFSDGAGGAIVREALGSEDVAFCSTPTGNNRRFEGAPSLRMATSLPTSCSRGLGCSAFTTTSATSARNRCVTAVSHLCAHRVPFVYVTMGAKVVLRYQSARRACLSDSFAQHKFTVLPGVNTLFTALMNHEDFAKLDFSALRHGLGGGMAVQRATAEEWRRVTGTP